MVTIGIADATTIAATTGIVGTASAESIVATTAIVIAIQVAHIRERCPR